MTVVNFEVIIKLVKEYYEDVMKKQFLVDTFRGVEGENNPFFSDACIACGGKLVKDGKFHSKQFKKHLRTVLKGELQTRVAIELGPAFKAFFSNAKQNKMQQKEILAEESSISEMRFQTDYEIDQVDFESSQEKNFEAADVIIEIQIKLVKNLIFYRLKKNRKLSQKNYNILLMKL